MTRRLILIALLCGGGFGLGLVLPVQSVGAWTPEECEQAPLPKPPDCPQPTTTIAPATTTTAPTSTTTTPTSPTTTPTSTSNTTQPVTNATVPGQQPYGGGDVGTAEQGGQLPRTGVGTFLLCIGLSMLLAGLIFQFSVRRAPKGELRGYWRRPKSGMWR